MRLSLTHPAIFSLFLSVALACRCLEIHDDSPYGEYCTHKVKEQSRPGNVSWCKEDGRCSDLGESFICSDIGPDPYCDGRSYDEQPTTIFRTRLAKSWEDASMWLPPLVRRCLLMIFSES